MAFPFLPERRTVIQVSVLFAIFIVGWHIPVPGLWIEDLPQSQSLLDSTSVLFSIFALNLTPFFTVLACVEIARLAIPPLARWQSASTWNAQWIAFIVFVSSLALSAWQGFGILVGLDAGGLVRPDAVAFIPVGLAAFIGSTALIIWLSDNFGLPDLGGGFWLLMAISIVAGLPEQIASLVNFAQVGQISGSQFMALVVSLLAGIALVIFTNRLVSENTVASGPARTSILLWPSYLAGVVAAYALPFLPQGLHSWPYGAVLFVETAYVAIMAVLIPVFVFAYARSFSSSETRGRWPLPVLLAICAVQIVLCVGVWLLPVSFGLNPVISGSELLVLGTVMLALGAGYSHAPPRHASRRH